jgi:hypothetical protein
VHTQFNHEHLRTPRPQKPYVEGWPPPRKHPPPRQRMRFVVALRLARVARRIDDRAAWRAFAP